MKTILLPFIFLIISLSSAFCQQKWFDQCFDPNDTYLSIHFADSLNGWIGSSHGKIYHTTDGGDTWSVHNFPALQVKSLQFFDANTGWAVGINDHHFGVDSYLGYTTDGGNTWQSIIIDNYPFNTDRVIQYISFCDRNNGVICGLADTTSAQNYAGTILKTTDGGKQWTVKYFSNDKQNIAVYPRDIKIISPDRVFAACEYRNIISTTDAGNSWNVFKPFTLSHIAVGYTSISFADNNTGWISGKSGTIIKTTNAGTNWIQLNPDTTINYTGISFLDKNLGLAVGYIGNISFDSNKNTIVRSTDGGLTWTPDTVYETASVSGVVHLLNKVYIAPSGRAWAFHGSTVLSTVPFENAPSPKINNYDSILCSGDSTILHAWPQGQEFTYLWSTGDTTANIVVRESGYYTVTVKNQYGTGSASANVIVYQRPDVKLNYSGKLTLCEGDSIILKTNIEHGHYAWYNDYDGSSMIVNQAGKYWLMASDSTGCWAYSDTLDVDFLDVPDFKYQYNYDYLAFNPVDKGKSSDMDFELDNQGTDFNIDTAYITGDTGIFSLTTDENYPVNLKSHKSFSFSVKFSPKEAEIYSALLIINVSTQCHKVIEVPVSGIGQFPSSVTENAAATNDRVRLYPNPVSDRLNIVFADKNITESKVSIINQLGECLLEKDLCNTENQSIDISAIPSGSYYCKIITNRNTLFAKFFVIK